MKAVILAAGEGHRMRPLTYARPKVMLPLANRPILEHLVLRVREAGIEDFVFIVGYKEETVRHYFGDGSHWEINIEYAVQRNQMGTAHALQSVEGLVNGKFLLVNGDCIFSAGSIAKVASGEDLTLSGFERPDVRDFGVVEVRTGRVVHIYEKVEHPNFSLVNAGLYLLTPKVFRASREIPLSRRGEYELTASLQLLIDEDHPILFQEIEPGLDISYPWDLLAANELVLASLKPGIEGEVEEGAVLKGAVSVGKGTLVKANSYVMGPVIIGDGCEIGPNCYIRPSTSIGEGCHIGSAVEVKNSIVMRGTKIPHHNYVGDSILGEGCNLGAGAKIANVRLDKADVRAGGTLETRRRKLGAILGDDVQVGINACINVGTLIGDGSRIGPGALASGTIAPGCTIL